MFRDAVDAAPPRGHDITNKRQPKNEPKYKLDYKPHIILLLDLITIIIFPVSKQTKCE